MLPTRLMPWFRFWNFRTQPERSCTTCFEVKYHYFDQREYLWVNAHQFHMHLCKEDGKYYPGGANWNFTHNLDAIRYISFKLWVKLNVFTQRSIDSLCNTSAIPRCDFVCHCTIVMALPGFQVSDTQNLTEFQVHIHSNC